MTDRRWPGLIAIAALLAGCGGGGGAGSGATAVTPAPTPAATGCSLRERQDWAAAQLREWYLFPDTLPTGVDPGAYGDVADYVDALTANARAQSKDRYFTYVTSIREEDAYYGSGSSAGFGVRLSYDAAARRLFVSEAFEDAPALAAGIDRGTEITAIGQSAAPMQDVATLYAAGGAQGVSNALGPNEPGVTRLLRVRGTDGTTREVSVAKADYAIQPVSSRYGATIIDDAGTPVGYINLRTFISTAATPLRDAMARFRAAGITRVIVDFRYNGGGLVSIAELMGDLLGGGRAASEVFSYTTFRPEKAAENDTRTFAPQPQSIAPVKIAFIGTGGTASASELVTNAFVPYLHANAALIGSNTYGKPVGQIARDRAACDDRLRIVAFATQNAARRGDYYTGLAPVMEATCRASDDIAYPMGDPREASTAQALAWLAGRGCAPISGALATATASTERGPTGAPVLLVPARPSTVQREVPGAF